MNDGLIPSLNGRLDDCGSGLIVADSAEKLIESADIGMVLNPSGGYPQRYVLEEAAVARNLDRSVVQIYGGCLAINLIA